jgi:hypothetical protein
MASPVLVYLTTPVTTLTTHCIPALDHLTTPVATLTTPCIPVLDHLATHCYFDYPLQRWYDPLNYPINQLDYPSDNLTTLATT